MLNTIQFVLSILGVTAFLTGYFFYLCFKTQVLAYFGRRAMDSSSLSYLFLLGCTPGLYFFTLLKSVEMLHIENEMALYTFVIAYALSAKFLMQWLAQGIKLDKVELDK